MIQDLVEFHSRTSKFLRAGIQDIDEQSWIIRMCGQRMLFRRTIIQETPTLKHFGVIFHNTSA
jgi:hypothetical protein